MIQSFLRGLGKLFFNAAAFALMTAVALIVFGTWLIKASPRDKKIQSLINFATAALAAAQAFQSDRPGGPLVNPPKS